jgi:hypothetical protein
MRLDFYDILQYGYSRSPAFTSKFEFDDSPLEIPIGNARRRDPKSMLFHAMSMPCRATQ